jgi:hypothetical protein
MSSPESDECRHDQESVDIEPYLEDAMDELIQDLFDGKRVGRWPVRDMHSFLTDLQSSDELVELCARSLIGGENFSTVIEVTLRKYLENTDTLYDRAERLAQEES